MSVDRRKLLIGSSLLAASTACFYRLTRPPSHAQKRQKRSRVAILHQQTYSRNLESALMTGLELFKLDLRGRSVLLKPNLVDYQPGEAINTHPALVQAAAECFRQLGAERVVVAEGPGHQRDTSLLIYESGFFEHLNDAGVDFVDLNRDELVRVRLASTRSGLDHLWLPKTVLQSDFVVSMPKLKTHHWAGVTLSMKNLFGIVPGSCYGWPKNILHWQGIHRSVVDICTTLPIAFVIADGIVTMEGNGPLNGLPRFLGKVILSDDPVAADATSARLMGLNPLGVPHILETSLFLGNADQQHITQLAEPVEVPQIAFRVVPEFEHLRVNRG